MIVYQAVRALAPEHASARRGSFFMFLHALSSGFRRGGGALARPRGPLPVAYTGGRLGAALFAATLAGVALLGAGCANDSEPAVARLTAAGEVCAGDTVACGGACVAVKQDPLHCGNCGVTCSPDELCDSGRCRPLTEGCDGDRLLCDRSCADGAVDPANCGTCGNACPSDGSCVAGQCECPGALAVCGEACVDLQTDTQHCGACGTTCLDAQTCQTGECACPGEQVVCGELCVDTQTDAEHCGACGEACLPEQSCESGACACPGNEVVCGELCIDTQTDAEHCGGCDIACTGGQICSEGACACPAGQALCDGACIDVLADPLNCGGCGLTCGLGEGCRVGACAQGLLAQDGCAGVVQDLSVQEVAAYQTVRSQLALGGERVENPSTPPVAGRTTLVRVFVEPEPDAPWEVRELSARLYLRNGEEQQQIFSREKLTIESASEEENRQSTFEFLIDGESLTSQSVYAVEVVECGSAPEPALPLPPLDGDLGGELAGDATQPDGEPGVAPPPADAAELALGGARFPARDGVPFGALDTGVLRVNFVPMGANGFLPDTSDEALNLYERAFLATYPVGRVSFSVSEPVELNDPQDWNETLDIARNLRQRDAPDTEVYYYGLVRTEARFQDFCRGACTAGVGFVPNGRFINAGQFVSVGLAFADANSAFTMLHEVGHNHGRGHSPCVFQGGSIAGVDNNYPYGGGVVGVYGYSAATDLLITPDGFSDLMGYCGNQWLSDYTYNGLLARSLAVNTAQASVQVAEERVGSWRVLMWDSARGSRWGRPISGPAVAAGEEEVAFVLDASGQPIESITVYRTEVADFGYSVQVPSPQADWVAIAVSGLEPLPF